MNEPPEPANSKIRFAIHQGSGLVDLEFFPASGVVGKMQMDVEQITSLIEKLGQARAAMVLGHPIPELEGQEINAVANTRWYTQFFPDPPGTMISFYHTAYGPVGFWLPPDQTALLVKLLLEQLQYWHSKMVTPPSEKPSADGQSQ